MSKREDTVPDNLPLGREVGYPEHYRRDLLCPIARSAGRSELFDEGVELPFAGADLWTAYELSWLNARGLPRVAIAELVVPCDSPSMVESKSLKLYLNGFNQTRFDSDTVVQETLVRDLTAVVGAPVECRLRHPDEVGGEGFDQWPGDCIDHQDIDISDTDYTAGPRGEQLEAGGPEVEETLISHLLKSNCRITSQPDWASVMIRYRGPHIDRAALLRYLVSFRHHDEFHEPCVERIFCDLMAHCAPQKLTVYARYTRRGGVDINPFRSNFEKPPVNRRLPRQ
ncbi:MAG: NADPH-dependent 7-cyano-7-deazaguanine reductase QueF [Pseudomonadota bacterium]